MLNRNLTQIFVNPNYDCCPRQPTKDEVMRWLPFLLQEIAIIRPKGLIILGKRTYEKSFHPYVV